MSTVKEASVKRGTSKSVGFMIGGLLVSIAIMFLVFWYMGRLAGYDKEYTGYAGEQQVLSQRIAKYALEASSGSKEAFDQVVKYRDRFGQTLSYMRSGNVATGLPGMGGTSSSIRIPSVGISQAHGDAIKAELFPGVNVKLLLDTNNPAGSNEGWVQLYAPNPVAPGSSISHWDTTATPNLLMEPFINSDLTPAFGLDLTPYLFEDIGWVLTQ